MKNCIGGCKFLLAHFVVRRRMGRMKTDNLLTARHPANFPTTARRDKISVRHVNSICHPKLLDYLARMV